MAIGLQFAGRVGERAEPLVSSPGTLPQTPHPPSGVPDSRTIQNLPSPADRLWLSWSPATELLPTQRPLLPACVRPCPRKTKSPMRRQPHGALPTSLPRNVFEGFERTPRFMTRISFRDRPIQPLSHLSAVAFTRLSGSGARWVCRLVCRFVPESARLRLGHALHRFARTAGSSRSRNDPRFPAAPRATHPLPASGTRMCAAADERESPRRPFAAERRD